MAYFSFKDGFPVSSLGLILGFPILMDPVGCTGQSVPARQCRKGTILEAVRITYSVPNYGQFSRLLRGRTGKKQLGTLAIKMNVHYTKVGFP